MRPVVPEMKDRVVCDCESFRPSVGGSFRSLCYWGQARDANMSCWAS